MLLMQALSDMKYLRAQTAAYLLPGMAVELVQALRDASAKQLKACGVPKEMTIASFITGGNFLFAPLSQQVVNTCCKLLAKLRADSQEVCPQFSHASKPKTLVYIWHVSPR
jgi:hypothetical protein